MIKINSIKYRHFKGIENFDLDLMGNNATVTGQNGSGKTTLADGLLWLLFGKDSKGASINPKPLDNANSEVLGLSPEVEAEMIIDGKVTILKRVQQETWTSKRGELEKTRGADITKYFIDTVPVKQKEWKDYLAALGNESILQILADSGFFMRLDWKKRREILVSMTDVTDNSIIAGDENLKELPEILGDHSVDDMRKVLAGQKKEIKLAIDGVPARIQEVTDMKAKLIADLGDLTQEEIKADIMDREADISDLQLKLETLKSTDSNQMKQSEIAKLKLELEQARTQYLTDSNLQTQSLQNDVMTQQSEVNRLRREKSDTESKLHDLTNKIQSGNDQLSQMKAERNKFKDVEFDDHKKICPTCGQDLPVDQIEKLVADFNQRKSNWLETDAEKGKALKASINELAAEKGKLEVNLDSIDLGYKSAEELLNRLNDELNNVKAEIKTFEETAVYQSITSKIEMIAAADDDTDISSNQKAEIKQSVDSKRADIADLQAKLSSFSQLSTFDTRIEELKNEDKRLKDQNQDVERKLWLLDEFTRKKVAALENSINEKFELVRWKLFNIQKNGALAEVCEATYQGIEYGTSLNTGARINCDLDIVNTLSKELGIKMPLFVDNTESVNQLISVDTQVIELKVGRNKALKVEV
ncbi:ATP-binding protein [Enterococcus sp. SMC-9]|uniref:ATP-binding protein n=1 Tax=Enterococcus sp. SMC-9 TaxID=2862343 RepID=UPI001E4904E4|nr:ATP-binding protein [Enterococcus sp. SMC-9]